MSELGRCNLCANRPDQKVGPIANGGALVELNDDGSVYFLANNTSTRGLSFAHGELSAQAVQEYHPDLVEAMQLCGGAEIKTRTTTERHHFRTTTHETTQLECPALVATIGEITAENVVHYFQDER